MPTFCVWHAPPLLLTCTACRPEMLHGRHRDTIPLGMAACSTLTEISVHGSGHRCRYVYAAIMEPSRTTGAFTGVVKLDLQAAAAGRSAEAGRIEHGGARLGGECVFVPAASGPQGATQEAMPGRAV